jgi:uncharacterized lipoprotein YddW (UPF0748 family)
MTVQTNNAAEVLGLVKQLSPREQVGIAEQIMAGLAQQGLLPQSGKLVKQRKQTTRSLRGIWAGKGFEKIINLEKEIKKARAELSKTILTRDF